MLAHSSCLGSEKILLLSWLILAVPYVWTRLRDFLRFGGCPFADGTSPCWAARISPLRWGCLFSDHAFVVRRFSLSLFASVKAWPLLWTVWAILLPGGGSFSNIVSNHGMGGADFSCQAGA